MLSLALGACSSGTNVSVRRPEPPEKVFLAPPESEVANIPVSAHAADGEDSFEGTSRLPSAELLPGFALVGPGYRIGETAEVVDYFGQYELRSDVGGLTADGAEVLRLRVHELAAVRALDRVSTAKVFGDAVVRGVERPVTAVRQVADEPKETMSGVPAGVGRFLKRTARNIRDIALDVNDAARDAMDKDEVEPSDENQPGNSERAQKIAKSATLRYIGYNKARRAIARQVNADPYSTNPLLDERLDRLAWASWSGEKLAGLGVGMIGGIVGQALGYARDAYELVWELPPEDLKRRNLNVLADLGIRGKTARDLIRRSKAFTLTQQTEFVELLRLPLFAPARRALFEQALLAEREVHARFLINALRMLLGSERRDAPGATAIVIGASPALVRHDGSHVIALPVDYLSWSPEIAEFAWREDLIGRHNLLLVTGSLSPRTLDAFSQAGWSVRQRMEIGAN